MRFCSTLLCLRIASASSLHSSRVCVRLRSRQIREKQGTSRARITPAAQTQTKTAFRNSLFFFICYRLAGRFVPVSVQALLADILQRIRRYCKNGFCACLIAAASPGFCVRPFPASRTAVPLVYSVPAAAAALCDCFVTKPVISYPYTWEIFFRRVSSWITAKGS